MKLLLFMYMSMCPQVTLVNKSSQAWSEIDRQVYQKYNTKCFEAGKCLDLFWKEDSKAKDGSFHYNIKCRLRHEKKPSEKTASCGNPGSKCS